MTHPPREMAVWVPENRKPMATVRRLLKAVFCMPVPRTFEEWSDSQW